VEYTIPNPVMKYRARRRPIVEGTVALLPKLTNTEIGRVTMTNSPEMPCIMLTARSKYLFIMNLRRLEIIRNL
jgi:hypothetical protein